MKKKYLNLISKLEPFCICSNETRDLMNNSVLNKRILDENIYDPLSSSSVSFVENVFKMDKFTFGDQGMAMDKWVFFDCAVMPGFCFGFAINTNELSRGDRDKLEVSENEMFPLSMYIAIPMAGSNKWFGHNLSSLNGKLEENLSGLGLLTKSCALDIFNIKTLVGATQWDSFALLVHKKFGSMKILNALTKIHSKNNTLCYESEVPDINSTLSEQENLFTCGNLFTPSQKNLELLQQKVEQGESKYIKNVYLNEGKLSFNI